MSKKSLGMSKKMSRPVREKNYFLQPICFLKFSSVLFAYCIKCFPNVRSFFMF